LLFLPGITLLVGSISNTLTPSFEMNCSKI
jgi:hypothetical protein